jgi:hypothetical protein
MDRGIPLTSRRGSHFLVHPDHEDSVRTLRLLTAVAFVTLALLSGCGPRSPHDAPSGGVGDPAQSPEAAQASQEMGAKLSTLINDASDRYRPLDYQYDEDLLTQLDRIDAYLSGKTTGSPPRFLPKLDEPEEVDHFRETIRRWQSATGKNLRAEVDKLKAEVDARKPGDKPFHPEFHKQFSAAFDNLIPIEVAEMRERRNKYIHANADAVFDPYRQKHPAAVRELEGSLNKPPYELPPPPPAPAPAAKTS